MPPPARTWAPGERLLFIVMLFAAAVGKEWQTGMVCPSARRSPLFAGPWPLRSAFPAVCQAARSVCLPMSDPFHLLCRLCHRDRGCGPLVPAGPGAMEYPPTLERPGLVSIAAGAGLANPIGAEANPGVGSPIHSVDGRHRPPVVPS